jgi:hypothetical protein
MDNEAFKPPQKTSLPEPPYSRRKDPYVEPPIKDFTHLLNGKPIAKKPKRHTSRNILIALLVIILLGGGGAGVYIGFIRPKPKVEHKTETAKTQVITNKPSTVPTTSYTSAGFGVTLSYPKNWTISDGGATLFSVTSQTVNGKIIVLFQPQGKIPAAFGTTSALAVLNSQLISFTSPTAEQAAQTYLSFVQYSSATLVGTMNGIYVTGNYGYQKDGTIPESDLTGLNPLITVTFGQCTGTNCSNLDDLSLSSNEWSNGAFSTPIINILKSLQFS